MERRYNGSDYVPELDNKRLNKQREKIKALMLDGNWRTIREIALLIKEPEASISAQLRHLRKERFGSYTVEKRTRHNRLIGLWEYRVLKGEQ